MAPLNLSAVAHFPATTFVSALGLVAATVFMDMTGGGIKPYEMQTARVAWAHLIGDASAAEALSRPSPAYTPRWRARSAPQPAHARYVRSDEVLGAGLLGGLDAEIGPYETNPLLQVVGPAAQSCPPANQWAASPERPLGDAAT